MGSEAATVIASASSRAAAARALGVHPSTVGRWVAAGKVPRPGSGKDEPVQPDADARAALRARIARDIKAEWDPRRALVGN